MFFIALTLVLVIWSYLYERKNIYNREDFFSFLYLYRTVAALISASVCGLLLVISEIYTDITGQPSFPDWVFVPFDSEEYPPP